MPDPKVTRDPVTDPQPYDIWLLPDDSCPAIVRSVSSEASSIYFTLGDGSMRDIGLPYWPQLAASAQLLHTWIPPAEQHERRPHIGTLPAHQPGANLPDVPPVSLDPDHATAPAAGFSGQLTVSITGHGQTNSWSADPEASATWFHLTSPAAHSPQSADGPVHYTADLNSDPASRTAHIYINGKTFTLTQEPAAPAADAAQHKRR